MAEAKLDANQVPVALATLNSDGVTPRMLKVDPTSHGIYVNDNTTGSDLSGDIAARDNNGYPVMMGVSSADGVTPTPVYITAGGMLLIDSS